MGKDVISCCQISTEQRGKRYSVHFGGDINYSSQQKPKQHFSTKLPMQKQGTSPEINVTEIDPLDISKKQRPIHNTRVTEEVVVQNYSPLHMRKKPDNLGLLNVPLVSNRNSFITQESPRIFAKLKAVKRLTLKDMIQSKSVLQQSNTERKGMTTNLPLKNNANGI